MKTRITKAFMLLAIAAGSLTSCGSDDPVNPPVVILPTSSFVANPANFQGIINDGIVTLDAGTVYRLTGKIQINDGATLTIPAGTVIEGVGETASYIAVAQGGKLNVNGTAANPVVMTSGLAVKAPGDWGGLVICGRAPINRVTGGTSSAQSEVADLSYGGSVANDNSGSITYLRIEYAGAAFNSEKEFNGVSLFGVGSGTVFSNVEAYAGADDGFEFFGGTVNTSNLISIGNEDDQFDWTEGWSGTNTNWYGKLDFNKGNRGIEADNYELGFMNTPISNPTITNITLVGPGSGADSTIYTENQAFKFRRGTRSSVTNAYVSGWKTGIDVEHDETISGVGSSLVVGPVQFVDVTTKTKGKTTGGVSADVSLVAAEGINTGAGNGANVPAWATGWAVGF